MNYHMRKFFFYSFIFVIFCTSLIQNGYAAINYTLTPIRYELEMQPWETKNLPASIKNNGTTTVTLPVTTSDFQSNGSSGIPSLVRKSELVYPDQEMSSWITLQNNSVTLAPWEEWTVNFNITVPEIATPGWHYGAVIFNNPGSEKSTGWNISINVDYWIIILVNIAWEVKVDAEIWDPIISVWGGTYSGTGWLKNLESYDNISENWDDTSWYLWVVDGVQIYQTPDKCPLGDLTPSRFDNSCISINGSAENTNKNIFNNSNLFSNDFNVGFWVPIKNIWNTHIKPSGQIILTDEDGKVIKSIWRETITNEQWAVIGEKIVDYIPFNDQGGNILPQTTRLFESEWKWFPYKSYDDDGNQVINYWTPSEFYTEKNKEEAWFLMFWERVSEKRQSKKINADIEIIYYDENGKEIVFNSAKDFEVQYIEQQITNNPYVILWIILFLWAWIMIFFAMRWWWAVARNRKCWNCKEEIKAHWETCPYCKTIQNKKEHKKYTVQTQKNAKIENVKTGVSRKKK